MVTNFPNPIREGFQPVGGERLISADQTGTDTSRFSGNLGTGDDTVQKALERLDKLLQASGVTAADVVAAIATHTSMPNAHHAPPTADAMALAVFTNLPDLTGNQKAAIRVWLGTQTSSTLSAVAHDATLTGTGAAADPLKVANPFTDADETKLDAIPDPHKIITTDHLDVHENDGFGWYQAAAAFGALSDARGYWTVTTQTSGPPTFSSAFQTALPLTAGTYLVALGVSLRNDPRTGSGYDDAREIADYKIGDKVFIRELDEIPSDNYYEFTLTTDSAIIGTGNAAKLWAIATLSVTGNAPSGGTGEWFQISEHREARVPAPGQQPPLYKDNTRYEVGEFFRYPAGDSGRVYVVVAPIAGDNTVKPDRSSNARRIDAQIDTGSSTNLTYIEQDNEFEINAPTDAQIGDKAFSNPPGDLSDAEKAAVRNAIGSGTGGGGGTTVAANPAGSSTTDLDKISIDGTVYNVLDSPILRGDPAAVQFVYAPGGSLVSTAFGDSQRGFFAVSPNADFSNPYVNWDAVQPGTLRYARAATVGYTPDNRGATVTEAIINGMRRIDAALGDGEWTITAISGVTTVSGSSPYIEFSFTLAKTGNFNGNSGIARSVIPDSADDIQVDIDEVNGLRSELEHLHQQDRTISSAQSMIPRVDVNPLIPSPAPTFHRATSIQEFLPNADPSYYSILNPADFVHHADFYLTVADASLTRVNAPFSNDPWDKRGMVSFHSAAPTATGNELIDNTNLGGASGTQNAIYMNLNTTVRSNSPDAPGDAAYKALPALASGQVFRLHDNRSGTLYTFTTTAAPVAQNTTRPANNQNSYIRGNLVRTGPARNVIVMRASDRIARDFTLDLYPDETGIVDPTNDKIRQEFIEDWIGPYALDADTAAKKTDIRDEIDAQRKIRNPASNSDPDTRLEPYQVKGVDKAFYDIRDDPHLGELVLIRGDGTEKAISPAQTITDHINIPKGTTAPTVAPAAGEEPLYLQEEVVTSGTRRARKFTEIPGWSSNQLGFTQGRNTRFTGDPYEVGPNNTRVWGNFRRWPNSNAANGVGIVETYMAWQAMANYAGNGRTDYNTVCDTYLGDYYYKRGQSFAVWGSYDGDQVCGSSTSPKIFTGAPGDDTPPTLDYWIDELVLKDSVNQRDGVDTVKYLRLEHVSGTRFELREDQNDPRFYEQPTTSIKRTLWFHNGARWINISAGITQTHIATFNLAGRNLNTGNNTNSPRRAPLTLTAAGTAAGYSQLTDSSSINLEIPPGLNDQSLIGYQVDLYWGSAMVNSCRIDPRQGAQASRGMLHFTQPSTTTVRYIRAVGWSDMLGQDRIAMWIENVGSAASSVTFPTGSKAEVYELHDHR